MGYESHRLTRIAWRLRIAVIVAYITFLLWFLYEAGLLL